MCEFSSVFFETQAASRSEHDLLACFLTRSYVLHLSNALGIVDSALTSGSGKRARKAEEGTEVARLRGVFQVHLGSLPPLLFLLSLTLDDLNLLQELDELAADKGESGLAISLSKPFQRFVRRFFSLTFTFNPSLSRFTDFSSTPCFFKTFST